MIKLINLIKNISINEIGINQPSNFLPIVKLVQDEDGEDDYIIDYDNLIKNVKNHQNKIAKYLNITDEKVLHDFLTYYVNVYQEVEHQGDEELYKDITLDEFLQDIKGMYSSQIEHDPNFTPDPDFDIYTKEEIFGPINEIGINQPIQYKKAYGESHSYNEYLDNEKKSLTRSTYFLVNLDTYKIVASFSPGNIPKWASNVEKQYSPFAKLGRFKFGATPEKENTYSIISFSTLVNPAPYMTHTPIDPEDPNSWDPKTTASRLIRMYSDMPDNISEAEDTISPDDPLFDIPAVEAPAPSEPSGEINLEIAKQLIFNTKGKIFTVVFIKKDGSERTMNARLGVKKYLRGGTLKFDAKEMGYIPVYDIQAKGYRMVNSNTIKKLKIGGKEYTIPTAISESKGEHEILHKTYENLIKKFTQL